MKSIAIITARGGSKRIPKKNIKEFCGRPIIAYGIEAAIESGLFEEVMVSTDSQEIAEVALNYGAKVPFFRSKATSNDYATTEDVLLEVLTEYAKRNKYFETVCCIYPTAPFITGEKLKKAKRIMDEKKDINAVVPVVKYSYPPQRGIVKRNGYMEYLYPENAMKRSQDLEPIYHDCGQFYYCRTSALEQYHDLVCPNCAPFLVPEEEVQDIDNYSDWKMAEIKYKYMMEAIK